MGCASSSEARASCFAEKYSLQAILGHGAYARVWLCKKRDAEQFRAVKIVECGNKESEATARHEAALWKRVAGHDHVVNLLETYKDESSAYFVMERCTHSLYDMLLNKTDRFDEAHLLLTFKEMLLALQHCHSVKVVHRDVKPENFLLSFDGRVKLCDFGLAALERKDGIVGLAGTPPYMSPEMVRGQAYNHKTDLWSLGATVYLMLYGKCPYQIRSRDSHDGEVMSSHSKLMRQAIATDLPPPTYVAQKGLHEPSLEAREFVQALLQRDPSARPSSIECFGLRAMLNLSKITKCVDPKKQRGLDENDGAQDTSPAYHTDGAQDVVDTTIEVIDQLQVRHSKEVIEATDMIEVIRRSKDSAGIKVNSAETCSKGRKMSQSSTDSVSTPGRKMSKASTDSVSTADTSDMGSTSIGQVFTGLGADAQTSCQRSVESEEMLSMQGNIRL